jgi:hypothetical protein
MSEPRQKPDPASVEAGYELHDVSARWLVLFAAVLASMVVVVCLFLIWLVGLFEARAAKHDPLLSPLAESQTPPATSPLLQANPKIDFAAKRAREDAVLGEYRWLDEERKTLRIPIDEAMRIIEREGVRPRGGSTDALRPDARQPNKPDEPSTDRDTEQEAAGDAASDSGGGENRQ